ncbi:hypothetical protein [Microbacterium azadirachtae]|uniref:hypothetical protein n=1 Tax=Microbacterium azadirachtae TaxID=582680 RepID=UPI001FE81B46|nr:hypothetical protein [Microbacterium azadirachtae]
MLCGGFPCQDVSTVGRLLGVAPGTRSDRCAHCDDDRRAETRASRHRERPRIALGNGDPPQPGRRRPLGSGRPLNG